MLNKASPLVSAPIWAFLAVITPLTGAITLALPSWSLASAICASICEICAFAEFRVALALASFALACSSSCELIAFFAAKLLARFSADSDSLKAALAEFKFCFAASSAAVCWSNFAFTPALSSRAKICPFCTLSPTSTKIWAICCPYNAEVAATSSLATSSPCKFSFGLNFAILGETTVSFIASPF